MDTERTITDAAVEAVTRYVEANGIEVSPEEIDVIVTVALAASSFLAGDGVQMPSWREIGSIIHSEAQEYEWRGDTDYTPTDHERAMLEDFGNALITAILPAAPPAQPVQP